MAFWWTASNSWHTPPLCCVAVQIGQVIATLNGQLAKADQTLHAAPPLQPCGVQLPCPYRYMMERLEDKVAAMQARMDAAVAAAKAALGGAWSEPVPVGAPVQVGCLWLELFLYPK
jgi:hypothetical protein